MHRPNSNSFYVLSTSFLRLFYVIGIMRYGDCILCIFSAYRCPDMVVTESGAVLCGVKKRAGLRISYILRNFAHFCVLCLD